MHKFTECRHILTNGRKCRAAALRGKAFCFHHAKLHFRVSRTRKPREITPSDFADLRSLRRATARALEALSSPLVDTRRAGLLLYGLHLAANLDKRLSASSAAQRSDASTTETDGASRASSPEPSPLP